MERGLWCKWNELSNNIGNFILVLREDPSDLEQTSGAPRKQVMVPRDVCLRFQMVLWMLIHSDCLPPWSLIGTGFNCSGRGLGVMEKMVTQL